MDPHLETFLQMLTSSRKLERSNSDSVLLATKSEQTKSTSPFPASKFDHQQHHPEYLPSHEAQLSIRRPSKYPVPQQLPKSQTSTYKDHLQRRSDQNQSPFHLRLRRLPTAQHQEVLTGSHLQLKWQMTRRVGISRLLCYLDNDKA